MSALGALKTTPTKEDSVEPEKEMTKGAVCQLIDNLWVTKTQREGLKYKIQTRMFTGPELMEWGARFHTAVNMQEELMQTHAQEAAKAPQVEALRHDYSGPELRKRRRTLAGRLLRDAIRSQDGVQVPPELSRQAVEKYL